MGGISMGAAVAVNVAVRYPQRLSALILCRPAWLDTGQAEFNRDAYRQIADLLDTHDVNDALATFVQTPTHRQVEAESPSAAESLRHQITRPRAAIKRRGSAPLPQLLPCPQPRRVDKNPYTDPGHRTPRRPFPSMADRRSCQHSRAWHKADRGSQQRPRPTTVQHPGPRGNPHFPQRNQLAVKHHGQSLAACRGGPPLICWPATSTSARPPTMHASGWPPPISTTPN